jgi:hypothetical protein
MSFSAFSAEKVKCFRVKEKKGKIKRITVKEKKSCKGKWVAVDDATKGLNGWMLRFKNECKDIQEKGSRTKKYTCKKSKANKSCKKMKKKLQKLIKKHEKLEAKKIKREADGKKVPKSWPKKLEKIKNKIITLKSTKIPTACGNNANAESTKIE